MESIDKKTREVLTMILGIQAEAYRRITITKRDKLFLAQFQSSDKEIEALAKHRYNYYIEVIANPNLIWLIDTDELATLRHILFKMEDTWVTKHQEGINKCWELFFSIEESRSPKLDYITNFIDVLKDESELER